MLQLSKRNKRYYVEMMWNEKKNPTPDWMMMRAHWENNKIKPEDEKKIMLERFDMYHVKKLKKHQKELNFIIKLAERVKNEKILNSALERLIKVVREIQSYKK